MEQQQTKRPNIFKRIGLRFKAMFSELKKVNWPGFKKTMKTTGIVFAVVAFFAVIIFAADFGLGEMLEGIIGI